MLHSKDTVLSPVNTEGFCLLDIPFLNCISNAENFLTFLSLFNENIAQSVHAHPSRRPSLLELPACWPVGSVHAAGLAGHLCSPGGPDTSGRLHHAGCPEAGSQGGSQLTLLLWALIHSPHALHSIKCFWAMRGPLSVCPSLSHPFLVLGTPQEAHLLGLGSIRPPPTPPPPPCHSLGKKSS